MCCSNNPIKKVADNRYYRTPSAYFSISLASLAMVKSQLSRRNKSAEWLFFLITECSFLDLALKTKNKKCKNFWQQAHLLYILYMSLKHHCHVLHYIQSRSILQRCSTSLPCIIAVHLITRCLRPSHSGAFCLLSNLSFPASSGFSAICTPAVEIYRLPIPAPKCYKLGNQRIIFVRSVSKVQLNRSLVRAKGTISLLGVWSRANFCLLIVF